MYYISTLSKTFFSYIPSNSIFAKLHPITKLFIVFLLSIIAFLLTNIFDLLVLFALDIFLITLLKVPLFSKQFRKIISFFLLANVSIFIAWCLFSTRSGNIIFFETTIIIIQDKWIWHILITDQTLFYASRISIRAVIMFFLMLFFFIGISDRDLIHGLRSMKLPFSLSLMINLIFRGLSMFQQEYSMVKEAMKTRGVRFEHISIPKKIKNFVSIFIVLIILMFKKTEDMSASIEARGIPLRSKKRTIYQKFPFKKKDFLICISLILFLIYAIYLNIVKESFLMSIINIFF
ncbi:MAG: energy-coupling factor transporter transmembrane component T family protein [Candidatus Hodarchaeota archaeon]